MKKINNSNNICPAYWEPIEDVYQAGTGIVNSKSNQIIYVWVHEASKGYFGAVHDGEFYISNTKWLGIANEKTLYQLIEGGLSPYHALELMEL